MNIFMSNQFQAAASDGTTSRAIFWPATLTAAAILMGVGTSSSLWAQAPALPAAAEPTAPASHIGAPVHMAPLTTTPTQTAPLGGSGTNTIAPARPGTTDVTVPPPRAAPGTRG